MKEESDFTLDELKRMYRGETEALQEVLRLFLADAPPRLEKLKAALAEEDLPAAAKAVHGLANLLGALRNYEGVAAARATERALKEGNLSAARTSASICEEAVKFTLELTKEELA